MSIRLRLTWGLLFGALVLLGCADPCADLKEACADCADEYTKAICELDAEATQALGGEELCQDEIDAKRVGCKQGEGGGS